MSRGKRSKLRFSGSFYSMPRHVHRSADYRGLSGNAVKALNALNCQYRGTNNGDLTLAFRVMQEEHGFNSKATLERAKKELLAAGMIVVSRQGGLGRCSLYALTWAPVDLCKEKLDIHVTHKPPRADWCQLKPSGAMGITRQEKPARKASMKRQKLHGSRLAAVG